MVFPVWIAGFLLTLIAAEVLVRIARWQLSQPVPIKRPSPFFTASLSFPVQLISLFGLFVACLALVKIPNSLLVLAPVLPLAGWCMCWPRGLERFVDQLYPNRSLVTIGLRDASLNPIGVLLAGIYLLSPFKSVLETVLISAALLPLFFWFSVTVTKRAYPAVRLDRSVLLSMAFRFAAGFLLIGLLCWFIWTFIPPLKDPAVCLSVSVTLHLVTYFCGTMYELDMAQRLGKKTLFVESDTVVASPPITAMVQEEDEAQTVARRR